MSQYQLKYHDIAPEGLIRQVADIVWVHPAYNHARALYPDPESFTEAMLADLHGFPALAAYSGDSLAAALSFTDLVRDLHMPGLGSIVGSSICHPEYPGAAGFLLRAYIAALRAEGAKWYQISKRLDATTVLTKYRRLHE
ncbi:hypothetical protein C171_00430 [Pseudomonas phage YMC11/06/C171_PPU_BP]|uniref:Uncharacterized protein n=1 Tax=Pseudomonas phage YMC11/06/C171_PPU_BP TaxID=1777063 RepID=A0A127KNJ7_9CAUD|nr:hypothetical protein BH776_gp43 [Pseudomonas phage YMC11/06/C171_PPU_BP]AMO43667.1 hypothetical protein C171_00430 [Pseudomonas phage YMC11/06/C171_PPU_BP]